MYPMVVITRKLKETMKQYEIELSKYLARKEPNTNLISDIQQYAKTEIDSLFNKSITPTDIYSYLLNAKHFDSFFTFWLTCYSQSISTDAEGFIRLLVVMFENEEIRAGMMQYKLDLELIEAFLLTNKNVKAIEEILKRIEVQWQKGHLSFGYLFTWLTKLFSTLNVNYSEADIKDESMVITACKHGIEIIKGFHVSSAECKGNIFTSTLILNITQFLISTLKTFPNIQSNVLPLIWELCEDKDYTLREKIELCYFFKDYFLSVQGIISKDTYWNILAKSISIEDIIINKCAIKMLKESVKEQSVVWKVFFEIYDMYENYDTCFNKETWNKINILLDHVAKDEYKEVSVKSMNRWVESLLRRLNNIENKQLQKYAIKYLLKLKKYPQTLKAYFTDDFFKLIGNPVYYKKSKFYVKENSIPSLIPVFIKSITNSESFTHVLTSIQRYVTEPEPLLYIFKGLSIIEDETQFITDTELEVIAKILNKQMNTTKKHELAKYLLTLLHSHMNITKVTFIALSNVFGFIPTSFYRIGGMGEMKYKNMLLLMLQDSITPSKLLQSLTKQILALYSSTLNIEEVNIESILPQFSTLCKIFGMLTNTLDFDNPSDEFDAITDLLQELFEKLNHSISSLYAKPFPIVSSLVLLQRLIHYFVKLGSVSAIKYLTPFVNANLTQSLGDYLLGISGQFLNPAEIKAEDKERLKLFATYKEYILKLLSEISMLVGYSTDPSTKLNKFSSYLISYSKLLLKNHKKNKSCSSIGLALILSFTDALLSKYSKIQTPRVMLEKVLDNVFPLLNQLQEAKLTEDSFNTTDDQITNQYINYWDAIKIARVSQIHLIEQFTLIGQQDKTSKDIINKNTMEIIKSIREHVVELAVDDIAGTILESIYNCMGTLYKEFIVLPEEDKTALIELITDCWNKWNNSNQYKVLVSLFGIVFHPVTFRFLEIRTASHYENLKGKILYTIDKDCLVCRAFVGQLVLLLLSYPECIKGIEDLLVNFALLQTGKGEDNTMTLAKSYFRVSTATQRKNVYYEEIDSYSAFIRISLLELFDTLIVRTKKAMIEDGWKEFDVVSTSKESVNEKFKKYVVVIESLAKIMINIINIFVTQCKEQKRTPMTYSSEYRKRLSIGQYTSILIKVFDQKIFTEYFRKTLCEVDPVQLIIGELKSVLDCPNVPILRNYFEVSAVKLALEFPKEVLTLLVIPSMCNTAAPVQIRSSVVFIACAIMDRIKDEKIQTELLKNLISYIGTHSGFTRSLTQIYLEKYSSMICEENKKLLDPYFDCLKEDKTAIKFADKVMDHINGLGYIIDNTSSVTVTSSPMNDFGEVISPNYGELIRKIIQVLVCVDMCEYR